MWLRWVLSGGVGVLGLPGEATVEIPYGVRMRIAQLARDYSAVQYDADDPNAEAIAAACENAGVQPQPSHDVPPRTIRGAVASGGPSREVAVLAAVVHTRLCVPQGAVPDRVCQEDALLASELSAELAARGWRVSPDARLRPVPA